VNYALTDVSLNKHFRTENRDQSSRTNLLKTKCSVDRTDYVEALANSKSVGCSVNKVARNNGTASRIDYLKHCNNNVKDNNIINGFTPDYAIYYNDSTLYRKKAACKLYNPPDAKIIAC
jgi:predicted P-loop ATPase